MIPNQRWESEEQIRRFGWKGKISYQTENPGGTLQENHPIPLTRIVVSVDNVPIGYFCPSARI